MLRSLLLAAFLLFPAVEAPTLASLSPSTVVAGDSAFWLTINGSGFAPGSVVRIDGAERTTTLLSPDKLAAMIAAHDIARVGSRQISVVTPAGDTSASLTLTVVTPPPAPKLLSISPSMVVAGGPALKLTVTGTDFSAASLIEIDGTERATFEATATSLTTSLPAEELTTPSTRRIRVVTPAPGGGVSAVLKLEIRPAP